MNKTLKEELVNIIKMEGQQLEHLDDTDELQNSWSEIAQPPTWQSVDDCEQCRCLVRWDNYPLGGGTRTFCGYWVLILGKPKKVELSKLRECPKNKIPAKEANFGREQTVRR